MGRTLRKFTPEQVAKAKELFLDYKTAAEIAKATGVTKAAIYYYAKEGWNQERELKGAELFDKLSDSKKSDFAEMLVSSQRIVKNYLKDLEAQDRPDPKDVKVAVQIITDLDKIMRLEREEEKEAPDDNEKPLTTDDLKKRLSADPFSDL